MEEVYVSIWVMVPFLLLFFFNKSSMKRAYKVALINFIMFSIIIGSYIAVYLVSGDKISASLLSDIDQGLDAYEILSFLGLVVLSISPMLIFLGFSIYYVIVWLQGDCDLVLAKKDYISWEKISGKLNLNLRNDGVVGTLTVFVRGFEIVWSWDNRRIHTRYEKEIKLTDENYIFEKNNVFQFEFDTPYLWDEFDENDLKILEADWYFDKQKKKENIKKYESGAEYITSWSISAVLDKKWIDIKNSCDINIDRIEKTK